ncbi:MAG TPA: signal peptidase I [Thermoanaerobaculia bacterium]
MRTKSLARTLLQPIGIAIVLAMVVRAAVHIYAIPSASMAPTLVTGDQVVVTPYFLGQPHRGDVVVFRSPLAADELMVKRVIGVPGDLIDSRLGRVRVGTHTLVEPYVARQAATGAIPAQIVPSGSYFVLGDNRDDSLDSRSWGVVPHDAIVGRARMILWTSPLTGREQISASTISAHETAARTRRARHIFKWVR